MKIPPKPKCIVPGPLYPLPGDIKPKQPEYRGTAKIKIDRTIKNTLDEVISSGKIMTMPGKGKGNPQICFLPTKRKQAEDMQKAKN